MDVLYSNSLYKSKDLLVVHIDSSRWLIDNSHTTIHRFVVGVDYLLPDRSGTSVDDPAKDVHQI